LTFKAAMVAEEFTHPQVIARVAFLPVDFELLTITTLDEDRRPISIELIARSNDGRFRSHRSKRNHCHVLPSTKWRFL